MDKNITNKDHTKSNFPKTLKIFNAQVYVASHFKSNVEPLITVITYMKPSYGTFDYILVKFIQKKCPLVANSRGEGGDHKSQRVNPMGCFGGVGCYHDPDCFFFHLFGSYGDSHAPDYSKFRDASF